MRSTATTLFALVQVILVLTACRFNPNIQGEGADFIQGIWQQESSKLRDSLLEYTTYSFKFTCDSFYVTLSTRSKANYYDDSCFNNGNRKEYAKGNYTVRNDTLYIVGTFTRENFKQKLSGCYRIGQFTPVFLIRKKNPKRMELLDLQQQLPITLTLKKKTTCNPQPL